MLKKIERDEKSSRSSWTMPVLLALFFVSAGLLSLHLGRLGPRISLGLPGLELLEQRFLVGLRLCFCRCRRILLQERVKPVAGDGLEIIPVQPLLGGRQAVPPRERRRQRDLLPLRVEGRILEGREFGEEGIHETRKLAI